MPNTFYMYKVNLVWVWRGWEVAIISYSMSPGRNLLKILPLSHRSHGGPCPAHKLHPLQRWNWYMSQRYRMMHTNARAVCWRNLDLPYFCREIDELHRRQRWNFHLLALYGRQLLHPAASLPCQHGINPSPTPYHWMVRAVFASIKDWLPYGHLRWYCQLRATAPIKY